jgi:hypothetical protein
MATDTAKSYILKVDSIRGGGDFTLSIHSQESGLFDITQAQGAKFISTVLHVLADRWGQGDNNAGFCFDYNGTLVSRVYDPLHTGTAMSGVASGASTSSVLNEELHGQSHTTGGESSSVVKCDSYFLEIQSAGLRDPSSVTLFAYEKDSNKTYYLMLDRWDSNNSLMSKVLSVLNDPYPNRDFYVILGDDRESIIGISKDDPAGGRHSP